MDPGYFSRRHFSRLSALALLAVIWPAAAFQQIGIHPLTGRHIAGVCGAGPCAAWLERPEREQEENPEGALDALDLISECNRPLMMRGIAPDTRRKLATGSSRTVSENS
jgi:hypothetical protein